MYNKILKIIIEIINDVVFLLMPAYVKKNPSWVDYLQCVTSAFFMLVVPVLLCSASSQSVPMTLFNYYVPAILIQLWAGMLFQLAQQAFANN